MVGIDAWVNAWDFRKHDNSRAIMNFLAFVERIKEFFREFPALLLHGTGKLLTCKGRLCC